MKTFRNFLLEAREAPLYHGTDIEGLTFIVERGEIAPGSFPDDWVAMSRDHRYSASWARQKTVMNWLDNRTTHEGDSWGYTKHHFVLEVDQRRLNYTHKIEPFDNDGHHFVKHQHLGTYTELDNNVFSKNRRLEREERTFKAIPLSYVSKIHFSGSSQTMGRLRQQFGLVAEEWDKIKDRMVYNSKIAQAAGDR